MVGLCEMRWTQFGEIITDEGHKLFYSGLEKKHEEGVGFLVHKNNINSVLECTPVSSRIMTIRLKASPFNVTIIQIYAPTTAYSKEEVEQFYDELQINQRQSSKERFGDCTR